MGDHETEDGGTVFGALAAALCILLVALAIEACPIAIGVWIAGKALQ